MNVYSVDIKIAATAYIKAESEEEALAKAKKAFTNEGLELTEDCHQDGWICGRDYDDPQLPEISLSPMMTADSVFEETLDLVEKDVPEPEKSDG